MREVFIGGAREGENLPSGEWATVVSGSAYVLAHSGVLGLPAPGDWPRYPRISIANGFQLAGQAQNSACTWWFKGGQWTADPRICNGGSAAIFDQDGALHIIEPGPDVPTQGYRYVADDGQLVTGDATYQPDDRDLSEFTDYTIGGLSIAIGQGHTAGGCVAVIQPATGSLDAKRADRTRKLLEPGNCTVIRVSHDADLMALAITTPSGQIFRWLTVAEIEASPDDVVGVPPLVVPPVIVDPVEPGHPMTTPDELDLARRVAAAHPDLIRLNTSTACGTLTEYIALALNAKDPGWGLLSKSPGENQYRGHAVDAVIYRPTQQVIDLMSGAGDRDPGSTVPTDQQFDIRVKWQEVGKRENNNWMFPILPVGSVPTVPPVVVPPVVTPPQPGVDLSGLLARLVVLEGREQDLVAATDALEGRLATLERAPSGPVHGTVHVKGRTKAAGTSFLAHSHEIDLEVPIA